MQRIGMFGNRGRRRNSEEDFSLYIALGGLVVNI